MHMHFEFDDNQLSGIPRHKANSFSLFKISTFTCISHGTIEVFLINSVESTDYTFAEFVCKEDC